MPELSIMQRSNKFQDTLPLTYVTTYVCTQFAIIALTITTIMTYYESSKYPPTIQARNNKNFCNLWNNFYLVFTIKSISKLNRKKTIFPAVLSHSALAPPALPRPHSREREKKASFYCLPSQFFLRIGRARDVCHSINIFAQAHRT